MKLIFQIAAGIILAVVIMYGAMVAYSNYQLKEVAEALKLEQLKATQFLENQRKVLELQQAKKAELRQKQQAKIEELRQERQAVINEQAARQQKINAAWNRYYKEPYNCKHPSSQNEYTWCGNYKRSEKKKFLDLLSQGKIVVG